MCSDESGSPDWEAICVRGVIDEKITVANGSERMDPSRLREGESVEVTYRRSYDGDIEAETVYGRTERMCGMKWGI